MMLPERRVAILKRCKTQLADVYHTLVRLDRKFKSTPGLASMLDARVKLLDVQNSLDVTLQEEMPSEQVREDQTA